MNLVDNENKEDIVYEKEHEFHEITNSRIHSLNISLYQCDQEISYICYQLRILEKDFRYILLVHLLRREDEEAVEFKH
jgi:hypothetical protein